MRRLLTLTFCFAAGICVLVAQDVSFYLNRDTISMDEELEINVLLTGPDLNSAPDFPEIEGFEKKESRRRRERSDRGTETVYTQRYRPVNVGTFPIQPFEVRRGQDAYLYPGKELVVLESELIRENYLEESVDAFLDFRLNKTECFVGEQVVAEALFYVASEDLAKIRLDPAAYAEFSQRMNNPSFWEERIDHPERFTRERKVGNKLYVAHQLYKGFLFALKPGEFPFASIYVEAEKRMVSKWATDYEVQVGRRVRFKTATYKAAPRSLKVKALPAPGSIRSVGNFTMEASIAPAEIETGERTELQVRIAGDGNVPLLPAPQIPGLDGFQRSDPYSSYQLEKTDSVMYGNKTFVYALVPAYTGTYEVGPVVFAYFDPRSGTYDSIQAEAISLEVTGKDRPEVLRENRLDGYYRLAFDKAAQGGPLYGRWFAGWAALSAIVAAALLVLGVWRDRFARISQDAIERREQKMWEELKGRDNE